MKTNWNIKKVNKDFVYVTLIFVIGVIAHFYLADFLKAIQTYPDEWRYYMIARSLFQGKGIEIREIPTNFQKLVYSIMLVPFFSIDNPILRIKLISLVNCFVMMLSIIPAWFIGKELKLGRGARYAILLIVVFWPDLMMSMTFMSEILYWPIFLTFIYLWILNERKKSKLIAIGEALLCYLVYMTKEIFLAMFLAYIAFEIVYPIIIYFIDGKKRTKRFVEYIEKDRCINLSIFVIVFLLCHAVLKFTVFRGFGNSYNQMGIEAILNPYNFAYMIYAFLYYIAAVLVAVLVIPVIYPIINFKNLNENVRKLYGMISLFFLVAIATIAYTISVREDLGRIIPRVHFRYLGPGFIVLMIVFICVLQYTDSKELCKKNRFSLELIMACLTFVCVFFKGIRETWVDSYSLEWYRKLNVLFKDLIISEDKFKFYTGAFIINLFLVVIVLLFHMIYIKGKKKWAIAFFTTCLAVVITFGNYATVKLVHKNYDANAEAVNEVLIINSYFDEFNWNPKILYLTDGKTISKLSKYMDTYNDNTTNLYYVDDSLITDFDAKDTLLVSETEFRESVWNNVYSNIDTIDYIILENNIDLGFNQLVNVELVEDISGDYYSVYKNLDSSVIGLEINPNYGYQGRDFYIEFYGEEYNALDYVVRGISWKEDGYSWTEGNHMEILIPVLGDYEQVQVTFNIRDTFNGEKTYAIKQSEKTIMEGVIEGKSEVSFNADVEDGYISFLVEMPDAEKVSDVLESVDGREVAFQIERIKISEVK